MATYSGKKCSNSLYHNQKKRVASPYPRPTRKNESRPLIRVQWNVVLVLNASGVAQKKYAWGLDLSGQAGDATSSGTHSAGGIGGLLACVETTGTNQGSYWYLFDGNGNVGQVITAAYRSIVARYEYDPYGNTIVASGDWAAYNPIRFSTKWFDDETGLGYWGYRYYNPKLGRWVNRDPIGERGGLNTMAFVANSPPRSVDIDGRSLENTAGGTLCNPDDGKPFPVLVPPISDCQKVCTLLHELVHIKQQESCCAKYAEAYRRATSASDRKEIADKYKNWIDDNRPLWDCLAYSVSLACELSSLGDPGCACETKSLAEQAYYDAINMAQSCAAVKRTETTPCPFE